MKTVYTAIFGDYDDLKEPMFVTPGWKYVCFTDQDIDSPVWEIRKVPVMPCGPVKTARHYKINFHKHIETEFSLWIDATFIINTNLDRWWSQFRAPFTTIDHPYDDCIYKDAVSCLEIGRGEPELIQRQIADYHNHGLPENFGLISSGILMRRRVQEVIDFCEQWWKQVEQYSSRDQVAFTYAYWNNPIVRHSIKWNYTEQREFIHIPHKGKPWRDAKMRKAYETNGAES